MSHHEARKKNKLPNWQQLTRQLVRMSTAEIASILVNAQELAGEARIVMRENQRRTYRRN